MNATEQNLFELPPAAPPARILCTRDNYKASCRERYHSQWLADALANWEIFEEHRDTFRAWCSHYRRDACLYIGAKAHNPQGTLSSMVWVMQVAIEPDRSRLWPCLDFEEHFQTAFIRRGLMIYLTLLLKEMQA